MKKRYSILVCVLFSLVCHLQARAGVIVNYTGLGLANGLNATAEFELTTSTNLQIKLTNTSIAPFGNTTDGSDMVLSSLNFDLGPVIDITGGSLSLNSGSNVVSSGAGNSWAVSSFNGDLNEQYAYSNAGVGNQAPNGTTTILSNITGADVSTLLDSVTSHNNGGNNPVPFVFTGVGNPKLPGGGLNFGLVAATSNSFGNSDFVLDSVIVNLTLSGALNDLDFLSGPGSSYVEFGSDHAFVGGGNPPTVSAPEPGTFAIWMLLGLSGVASRRVRPRSQSGSGTSAN